MPSSIGSDAFALLSILIISVLVLLLLRHYLPLRSTPAYLTVPVFLGIALPVSIILLVPIDLASSSRVEDEGARGIWLHERAILVAWRITYWLTFALTWFILPLLGEYVDSGYRTPKDRFLYSVRSNARYQLIVLGCAIAAAVYVFLQNGFQGTSVKALVMALAYCWGLVFAIYLMGHGLVAVPRRLVRNANMPGRLRRIQTQAPRIHDRLTTGIAELEDLEAQLTLLRQRKNAISRDHEEWVEELADSSELPESRLVSSASNTARAPMPAVVTDRYLAELTRKLVRARHKRIRFIDAWDRLVQDAVEVQAVIDAAATKRLDFGRSPPHAPILHRITVLTPYTRYLLYSRVVPGFRLILAAVLALASISVVWSELVKFVAPKLSIISLTVVGHRKDGDGEVAFTGQLMAVLWLTYMCTATLASFEDVKVWGNRALVPRNTYGESAVWYSGQIAKLTVPLAYNFVTFLPRDVHRETTFYHFLGSLINLTPLGKGFDYFFPIFILLPICATLFHVYARAKNLFGFGILGEDDEESPPGFGAGGWPEGRELIERELNGTSRLGLTRRDGSSYARAPSNASPVGASARQSQLPLHSQTSAPTARPQSDRRTTDQDQAQRLAEATRAAEEADENVFSGFAHRVRNTFDTVERPEWLSDLGKRPKWMSGVNNSGENSGRADSGRGMGRWFGGRPADGRVRL